MGCLQASPSRTASQGVKQSSVFRKEIHRDISSQSHYNRQTRTSSKRFFKTIMNEIQKYKWLRDRDQVPQTTRSLRRASSFKLYNFNNNLNFDLSTKRPATKSSVPVSGMVHINRPPQGRTSFNFIGLKSWGNLLPSGRLEQGIIIVGRVIIMVGCEVVSSSASVDI